jgi:hypothetical protein
LHDEEYKVVILSIFTGAHQRQLVIAAVSTLMRSASVFAGIVIEAFNQGVAPLLPPVLPFHTEDHAPVALDLAARLKIL